MDAVNRELHSILIGGRRFEKYDSAKDFHKYWRWSIVTGTLEGDDVVKLTGLHAHPGYTRFRAYVTIFSFRTEAFPPCTYYHDALGKVQE